MRELSRSANIDTPPSPSNGVRSIPRRAGSRMPSSISRSVKGQPVRPARPRTPVYVYTGPVERFAKDKTQSGNSQLVGRQQLDPEFRPLNGVFGVYRKSLSD